jgi:hypothetical protein
MIAIPEHKEKFELQCLDKAPQHYKFRKVGKYFDQFGTIGAIFLEPLTMDNPLSH